MSLPRRGGPGGAGWKPVSQALLRLALRHTGGNQVHAARVLGISRQTLRAKMRELGLSPGGGTEAAADDWH